MKFKLFLFLLLAAQAVFAISEHKVMSRDIKSLNSFLENSLDVFFDLNKSYFVPRKDFEYYLRLIKKEEHRQAFFDIEKNLNNDDSSLNSENKIRLYKSIFRILSDKKHYDKAIDVCLKSQEIAERVTKIYNYRFRNACAFQFFELSKKEMSPESQFALLNKISVFLNSYFMKQNYEKKSIAGIFIALAYLNLGELEKASNYLREVTLNASGEYQLEKALVLLRTIQALRGQEQNLTRLQLKDNKIDKFLMNVTIGRQNVMQGRIYESLSFYKTASSVMDESLAPFVQQELLYLSTLIRIESKFVKETELLMSMPQVSLEDNLRRAYLFIKLNKSLEARSLRDSLYLAKDLAFELEGKEKDELFYPRMQEIGVLLSSHSDAFKRFKTLRETELRILSMQDFIEKKLSERDQRFLDDFIFYAERFYLDFVFQTRFLHTQMKEGFEEALKLSLGFFKKDILKDNLTYKKFYYIASRFRALYDDYEKLSNFFQDKKLKAKEAILWSSLNKKLKSHGTLAEESDAVFVIVKDLFSLESIFLNKMDILSQTALGLKEELSLLPQNKDSVSFQDNLGFLVSTLDRFLMMDKTVTLMKESYLKNLKDFYEEEVQLFAAGKKASEEFKQKSSQVLLQSKELNKVVASQLLKEFQLLAQDRIASLERIEDLIAIKALYQKHDVLNDERVQKKKVDEILKIVNQSLMWGIVR